MASETRTTTDHQEIRKWAESRNGMPATVAGTAAGGEEAGLLRIHFPDAGQAENLKEISWQDFFDKFEEQQLAFLHQNTGESGETSYFFKFVRR